MAAVLLVLFVVGAVKAGHGIAGGIRMSMVSIPALAVSGIAIFLITAFTGDPRRLLAFLIWAVSAFLLFVVFARKVAGFWPEAGLTLHGSARWASFRDMRAARRVRQKDELPQGFALGRAFDAPGRADPRLFYQGHVLTVAPTGTGKGVGAVIPNLLTYEGSAIVLDIKGENYAVTARARAEHGAGNLPDRSVWCDWRQAAGVQLVRRDRHQQPGLREYIGEPGRDAGHSKRSWRRWHSFRGNSARAATRACCFS